MRLFIACLMILATISIGCAKRPVLYPNAQVQDVGIEASERDVDECIELAKAADLDSSQTANAAKSTGKGAAVGGVSGAVGGAISGRPGYGAAVGASVGAIGGFFSWLFGGASEPDPIFVRYVDRCLAERGYETIGWK